MHWFLVDNSHSSINCTCFIKRPGLEFFTKSLLNDQKNLKNKVLDSYCTIPTTLAKCTDFKLFKIYLTKLRLEKHLSLKKNVMQIEGDASTIFGGLCHFWRNVTFLEEYAIYGGMCHFWRNVPFSEECAIALLEESAIFG